MINLIFNRRIMESDNNDDIVSVESSPGRSKPTQEKQSDDSYPQRTEAETDVWSPELSNANNELNNTDVTHEYDEGGPGSPGKKLLKKKKKSKLDVNKQHSVKKAPPKKGAP